VLIIVIIVIVVIQRRKRQPVPAPTSSKVTDFEIPERSLTLHEVLGFGYFGLVYRADYKVRGHYAPCPLSSTPIDFQQHTRRRCQDRARSQSRRRCQTIP
jgi:hypothetical protein